MTRLSWLRRREKVQSVVPEGFAKGHAADPTSTPPPADADAPKRRGGAADADAQLARRAAKAAGKRPRATCPAQAGKSPSPPPPPRPSGSAQHRLAALDATFDATPSTRARAHAMAAGMSTAADTSAKRRTNRRLSFWVGRGSPWRQNPKPHQGQGHAAQGQEQAANSGDATTAEQKSGTKRRWGKSKGKGKGTPGSKGGRETKQKAKGKGKGKGKGAKDLIAQPDNRPTSAALDVLNKYVEILPSSLQPQPPAAAAGRGSSQSEDRLWTQRSWATSLDVLHEVASAYATVEAGGAVDRASSSKTASVYSVDELLEGFGADTHTHTHTHTHMGFEADADSGSVARGFSAASEGMYADGGAGAAGSEDGFDQADAHGGADSGSDPGYCVIKPFGDFAPNGGGDGGAPRCNISLPDHINDIDLSEILERLGEPTTNSASVLASPLPPPTPAGRAGTVAAHPPRALTPVKTRAPQPSVLEHVNTDMPDGLSLAEKLEWLRELEDTMC